MFRTGRRSVQRPGGPREGKGVGLGRSWPPGSQLTAGSGDAELPCSLKTLLHASLTSSVLASLIVHQRNLDTRPKKEGGRRNQPPLYSMLVAKAIATASLRIADLFALDDPF